MIPIKESYIIDKDGKAVSVVIKKQDYEKLLKYVNELEDIAVYDRAKKENGPAVSWKDIKR